MPTDSDFNVVPTDPGEVGREEHGPVDRFIVIVSNWSAWLFPLLMMAIVSQVFLRSAGMNQAWLDDFQWWLYGVTGSVGVAYAVTTNSHVRVDIFHANFSEERQAWIEVFALTWLFLPFLILMWDISFHYAAQSVANDEGSDSPNGLHNLWILKCLVNLLFVFTAAAVWAAYVRFLDRNVEPSLFNQALFALPSTIFVVNLTVFYALYWWLYISGGPDLNPRQIVRQPVFDYSLWITFVATALLLAALYVAGRRRGDA